LVIKNREGIFVVDVTVRHEDGDYLRQARKGKIDKYEKLLPDLKKRLKADKGEVLPIVVGTRGVIPNETLLALEKLKIRDKSKLTTISMITLRKSITALWITTGKKGRYFQDNCKRPSSQERSLLKMLASSLRKIDFPKWLTAAVVVLMVRQVATVIVTGNPILLKGSQRSTGPVGTTSTGQTPPRGSPRAAPKG
jgi:hypothetical protein